MSLERAITARWEAEVGDDALELRGKGEKGLSGKSMGGKGDGDKGEGGVTGLGWMERLSGKG